MNLPVLASHPECRACDLSELGCRHVGMPTIRLDGPRHDTAVVFVGKWPSSIDDQTGKPFSGSEGQILRGPLLGPPWPGYAPLLDRATVYLANTLRCHPKGLRDFTPKPRHLSSCRPWLEADLHAISTQHLSVFLVLCGAEACRSLLGCAVREAIRANPHGVAVGASQYTAIATYNPAILTRDPSLWPVLNDHLCLLHRLLDGDLPSPEPDIIEWRDPRPTDPRTICIDIETYGAVERLSDGSPAPPQTVFHPARMEDADACPPSELIQSIAISFMEHDGQIKTIARPANGPHLDYFRSDVLRWLAHATQLVGFNLPFDVMVLRHVLGRDAITEDRHTLFDGQVLNYLDSEVRVERSLKNIGHVLGTHSYGDESTASSRFLSSADASLLQYNARDTHRTLLTINELTRRIGASSDTRLSSSTVAHYSSVLWTAVRMGEDGIPIDRAVLQAKANDLQAAMRRIKAECPIPISGPGSGTARDNLYTDAARRCPVKLKGTKTKAVSGDKNNRTLLLLHLPPDDPARPLLQQLAEFDRCRKLLSSYFTKYLNHPRERHINGVLYPTWWVVPSTYDSGEDGGTVGSRFSAKNPAIQTWPREVESILRSRYPGSCLGWPDLSQIEWRVAGVLSGDPAIAEECRSSDPHTIAARLIYGEPALLSKYGPDYATAKSFRSFERQCGKHARFTRLNLGSPPVIQSTILKLGGLELTLAECADIHARLAVAYRRLDEWQREFIAATLRSRVIELPLTGHTRRLYGPESLIESTMAPTIVNFPIQTIAAIILQAIQARLRVIAPSILQCFQTHDSLCMDHPDPAYMRQAWIDAVEWVQTHGYYARVCDHYGSFIPLAYEWKTTGSHIASLPGPAYDGPIPFVPNRGIVA